MNLFDVIQNRQLEDVSNLPVIITDNNVKLKVIKSNLAEKGVQLDNICSPYVLGNFKSFESEQVKITFFNTMEEVIKVELIDITMKCIDGDFNKLEDKILSSELLAEIAEDSKDVEELYSLIKDIINKLTSTKVIRYLDPLSIIGLFDKEPINTNILKIKNHIEPVMNLKEEVILSLPEFMSELENKSTLYKYFIKTIQVGGLENKLYSTKYKLLGAVYGAIGKDNIDNHLAEVYGEGYRQKYISLISKILNGNYMLTNFSDFKLEVSQQYDINGIIYFDVFDYIEMLIACKMVSNTKSFGDKIYNFAEYSRR